MRLAIHFEWGQFRLAIERAAQALDELADAVSDEPDDEPVPGERRDGMYL
ncbi:hypothetical protein AB0I95_15000 [Micromonospora sp. NPDC049751]